MALKGLPSTYNKDMQEDKEALFDCVRTAGDVIRIMDGVIATLTVSLNWYPRLMFQVNADKMKAALTMDMLATDLADYLVRKGVSIDIELSLTVQVPFRETHHISGRAVALAEATQSSLDQLTFEQLRSLSDKFEQDVTGVFDFEASVEKRNTIGGPSRQGVLVQIKDLREDLKRF